MEKIGIGGRELLEYLLDDACEAAQSIINELPEPVPGVSKWDAFCEEKHRFELDHDMDEATHFERQLSGLPAEELKRYEELEQSLDALPEGDPKGQAILEELWKFEEDHGLSEESDFTRQFSELSPGDFKRYKELEQALWAFQIISSVEGMKKRNNDVSKLESGYLGANMYFIGQWYGMIIELADALSPDTMKRWRSLCASGDLKMSRWHERNRAFECASKLADDLWSKGDDRMHNYMVKYVLEQIKEFSSIRDANRYLGVKRSLLKKIGELAKEKYPDRFFNPGGSTNGSP